MKKVLIICAGGMSSSVIAKKTTENLQAKGEEIQVDATSQSQGANVIAKDEYDLYLVSPQTKMYFDSLEECSKIRKTDPKYPTTSLCANSNGDRQIIAVDIGKFLTRIVSDAGET